MNEFFDALFAVEFAKRNVLFLLFLFIVARDGPVLNVVKNVQRFYETAELRGCQIFNTLLFNRRVVFTRRRENVSECCSRGRRGFCTTDRLNELVSHLQAKQRIQRLNMRVVIFSRGAYVLLDLVFQATFAHVGFFLSQILNVVFKSHTFAKHMMRDFSQRNIITAFGGEHVDVFCFAR